MGLFHSRGAALGFRVEYAQAFDLISQKIRA